MIANIHPDKNNWKQFCQEPPLSDTEYAEWLEMAAAMRRDDAVFDFMWEATRQEWAAVPTRSEDWADMVAWADADRRLRRAEIAAWRKYKQVSTCRKEHGDETHTKSVEN